jgi:hypothetical protein
MTRQEKIAYCVKHKIFITDTKLGEPVVFATAEQIDQTFSDEELDLNISIHDKAYALGVH